MNSRYNLFIPSLLCVLVIGSWGGRLHGQTGGTNAVTPAPKITPAPPDPALRVSLEGLYESWRHAVSQKDVQAWERVTAMSRQIQVRNRIVSEKAPWPQAFFDDPLQAPSLGGLIALGCFNRGDTASSVYFGKANFGMVENASQITDNLLVLRFMRDDGLWKFDNLRVVKIGNDGELLLKIRNRDFSFLNGEEFQPLMALPPLPQPVDLPDYIAEAWVTSVGYKTEVYVNGNLTAKIANNAGKELVIGGVRRGPNQIVIRSQMLDDVVGKHSPKVEVAIYAAFKQGDIRRVYHLPSGGSVQAEVTASFTASSAGAR